MTIINPNVKGFPAPVIDPLTITPTASPQTITATGNTDGYSPITVNAVTASVDANIIPANIVNGVSILGVTGNYAGVIPSGTISISSNGTYDVSSYASAYVSVSGSTSKYTLYQRVKDDNNTDIGIVVGFRTDSSNNEYAVVCLNGNYRTDSTNTVKWWNTTAVLVDGLPQYNTLAIYESPETATFNCDKIVAQATTSGTTSPAVDFCRNSSFIIDNTTYYGQLPTVPEMLMIMSNYSTINSGDPSALNPLSNLYYYTSNQYSSASTVWGFSTTGAMSTRSKTTATHVVPILELPNS